MPRRRWLPALLLLSALGAGPAGAGEAEEAVTDILLGTLRSNKQALVAVNLQLTDEQARAFWPVYERYQQELAAIQDRLLGVIDDYSANFGKMTDEKALQLVEDYLAVERDRVELRRSYLGRVAEALPGVKVMRFYQIENKIDAILRYELAATIPVVEDVEASR